VASASSRTFEDMKVGVRCKIAALWIAMLFLAYGDIFGFFSQGQLEELAAGQLSGMRITQASCSRLAVCRGRERDGVPLAGPQPTVNRWTNIVLAWLYVVSIVASAIGKPRPTTGS
jgi:hypothetical protein